MSNPYVGEIRMGGWNFAPAGWATCDGQLMPISENETLFALVGTSFGGDGQSTFGIPDLRGRVPMHQGNSATFAQIGGVEQVTINANTYPSHSHTVSATSNAATGNNAANGYFGTTAGFNPYSSTTPSVGLNTTLVSQATGGSQPHDNMQPYLVINFIISLFGIFPSQT